MAATQVIRSEWTKIRSVASTVWTLGLAAVVTIALGALISLLLKNQWSELSENDRLSFDPTYTSFAGMSLGQLAMIVFGVLVVSNEYSTGMIRTSLAAVPQRGLFLASKLAVAAGLAFAVGVVTSFTAFFLGQAMLGDHSTSIGDPGVLRAVIGGALYMTLIALFSMGVAAMLRSPMLSLGILMPFFFSSPTSSVPSRRRRRSPAISPTRPAARSCRWSPPSTTTPRTAPGAGSRSCWRGSSRRCSAGMCCSRSGTREQDA